MQYHKDYFTDGDDPEIVMEHTRGLWVRKNRADNMLEIWFNGTLEAAWEDDSNIEGRLTTMMRVAVDIGRREAKREIREILGCRE